MHWNYKYLFSWDQLKYIFRKKWNVKRHLFAISFYKSLSQNVQQKDAVELILYWEEIFVYKDTNEAQFRQLERGDFDVNLRERSNIPQNVGLEKSSNAGQQYVVNAKDATSTVNKNSETTMITSG